MRASRDDLFDLVPLNQFDVLCGKRLIQVLVTKLAYRLTTTLLFFTENADFETRGLAELNETFGDLDIALVKRSVAADKIQQVDIRILFKGLDA